MHAVMENNSKQEIERALAPVLLPNTILCTDGNPSYSTLVKNLPFDIEHKRFRGVATHYLDSYIAYFRFLDSDVPSEYWVTEASKETIVLV